MTELPRGIRNNNPGNVRRDGTAWLGMWSVQNDPAFCQFIRPEDGLRCMFKVLLTYFRRYGLQTVEDIIGRYAPPSENKTEKYIADVARGMRVRPDQLVDLEQTAVLVALGQEIVLHEQGRPPADEGGKSYSMPDYWYPVSVYVAAARRALT